MILATTDLSRASYAALRRAADLARRWDARLEILHVLPQGALNEAWKWFKDVSVLGSDQAHTSARKRLQEWAAHLYLESGVTADVHLVEGISAKEIVRRAAGSDASLVVIGAHGEHALLDLFVGTTAEKVIRLTGAPVLLVKQSEPTNYRRILLPTDFSESSRAAIELAIGLFPGAEFDLFHAYELPYEGAMRYALVAEDTIDDYLKQAAIRLREQLEDFARSIGLSPEKAVRRARHGHAPTRIIAHAREIDADLVVMGAHGRSGFEATILGSVTSHVITESFCDVLVVKHAPTDRAG